MIVTPTKGSSVVASVTLPNKTFWEYERRGSNTRNKDNNVFI
jgi:hypothetical protein